MNTPLLQRLSAADLGEGWHRTVTVPPDHHALLYTDHQPPRTVGPGTHTLDTRLARLNRLGEDNRASAVLLRDGPWALELSPQALEGETVTRAWIGLSLVVVDPPLLVTELLGARTRLTAADLGQRLEGILGRCITPRSDDPGRIAARIAADLGTWLARDWGLRLDAVPTVDLTVDPERAHLEALWREHWLALTRLGQQLGLERLSADFQRGERVAEARTDAQVGDIRRQQTRADLAVEAERERLWRERMAFLVELDRRWE